MQTSLLLIHDPPCCLAVHSSFSKQLGGAEGDRQCQPCYKTFIYQPWSIYENFRAKWRHCVSSMSDLVNSFIHHWAVGIPRAHPGQCHGSTVLPGLLLPVLWVSRLLCKGDCVAPATALLVSKVAWVPHHETQTPSLHEALLIHSHSTHTTLL